VLVLLTDGANTAGEVEPLKAAELAQQVGLRIYTIGIGAEQLEVASLIGGRRRINPSADLDEATLTQIAELTGGRYFRATDTASLQDIYRLVDELEPVEEPESGFRPVKSLFFWPLGAAFALILMACALSLLQRLLRRKPAGGRSNAG
jgi:Ca-activated chloride channel family protein